VRVPLLRSDQQGGTTVAHYWMREGSGDASGARDSVKFLGVDLDELDADDILTQEVIYAFEGEKPTWHNPADGFAPGLLASEYGERFRDAEIVHVTGINRDFYCLAAHGAASLQNALDKEILGDWESDGDDNVERATTLLFGFTDWSKLRRHGIVPVDQHHHSDPLFPSVTINGQTPIVDGVPQFAPGDVIERDRLQPDEILAEVYRWEKTLEASPALSDFVHQYAGTVTTNKLHRAFFFPTKESWTEMLGLFQPGGNWELSGDVMDFYGGRHRSLSGAAENTGDWVVRFEVFGLEGVPVERLVEVCGGDKSEIRNSEWMVPGPMNTGVLRIDRDEGNDRGYAVVYLLAE
jgi:hypothetical protein